jgi:lysophospholipase L1-like esterase
VSRPPAQLALKLLLAACSLGVALAAGEMALRMVGFGPDELHLFRNNPSGRGSYRLRPNLSLSIPFNGVTIPVTTNSSGMRWREVQKAPPPGKYRVAFVGDSFTFGQWADRIEDAFVGVADAMLGREGMEVLNFGVPGYGLLDMELLIEEDVLGFRPDAIVIVSYTGNDFLDTYLGLGRYSVRPDGELMTNAEILKARIPESFRGSDLQARLVEHVRLARVAQSAWKWVRPAAWFRPESRPEAYTSDLFWSQSAYPAFARSAAVESIAALRRIASLCDSRRVRLLVASLPSVDQVRLVNAPRRGYDSSLPQRHVLEFAANAGVPYVDLLPALAGAGRIEKLYHVRDGHFTSAGHHVAGERLARFVSAERGAPPMAAPHALAGLP